MPQRQVMNQRSTFYWKEYSKIFKLYQRNGMPYNLYFEHSWHIMFLHKSTTVLMFQQAVTIITEEGVHLQTCSGNLTFAFNTSPGRNISLNIQRTVYFRLTMNINEHNQVSLYLSSTTTITFIGIVLYARMCDYYIPDSYQV